MNPPWKTPVVIDYFFKDETDVYKAQLVNTYSGVEEILGAVYFKVSELITSKGEFLFKKLEFSDAKQPKNRELQAINIEDD